MLQLPNIYASKIDKAISGLANNPRPKGFKKLKGIAELYRIKINDYRILYNIQDNNLIIQIIKIAHRKDIYKK